MKGTKSCLVPLMLLVVGSVLAEPSQPCPGVDPASNSPVLLPDSEDCSVFYSCVGGEPVLEACPSGLHFSPLLSICDWPSSAGCQASVTASTGEATDPNTETPTDPPTTSPSDASTGDTTSNSVTDEAPAGDATTSIVTDEAPGTTTTNSRSETSVPTSSPTEVPTDNTAINSVTNETPATTINSKSEISSPTNSPAEPATNGVTEEAKVPSTKNSLETSGPTNSPTEAPTDNTAINSVTNETPATTIKSKSETSSPTNSPAEPATNGVTVEAKVPSTKNSLETSGPTDSPTKTPTGNTVINSVSSEKPETTTKYNKENISASEGSGAESSWNTPTVPSSKNHTTAESVTTEAQIQPVTSATVATRSNSEQTNSADVSTPKGLTEPVTQSTSSINILFPIPANSPRPPRYPGTIPVEIVEKLIRSSEISLKIPKEQIEKAILYIKQKTLGKPFIPKWQLKKLIAGLAKSLVNKTLYTRPDATDKLHSWFNNLTESIRAVARNETLESFEKRRVIFELVKDKLNKTKEIIHAKLRGNHTKWFNGKHRHQFELPDNSKSDENFTSEWSNESASNSSEEISPTRPNRITTLAPSSTKIFKRHSRRHHQLPSKSKTDNSLESEEAKESLSNSSEETVRIRLNRTTTVAPNTNKSKTDKSSESEETNESVSDNSEEIRRNRTTTVAPSTTYGFNLHSKRQYKIHSKSKPGKSSESEETKESLSDSSEEIARTRRNRTTTAAPSNSKRQYKIPSKSKPDKSSESEETKESAPDSSEEIAFKRIKKATTVAPSTTTSKSNKIPESEETKESVSDSSEEIVRNRRNITTTAAPSTSYGLNHHARRQYKLQSKFHPDINSESEETKESVPDSSEEIVLTLLNRTTTVAPKTTKPSPNKSSESEETKELGSDDSEEKKPTRLKIVIAKNSNLQKFSRKYYKELAKLSKKEQIIERGK